MRIYQGHVTKGDFIVNTRTKKRVKVSRLIQMHADKMQVGGAQVGVVGGTIGGCSLVCTVAG